jgi:sugar phosphate isomerase/epimerase
MKIGLSSYSLVSALRSGEMTILDAIDWVADKGGQHIEIVPIGFDLIADSGLIDAIRKKADDAGLDLSNYAIGANFITKTEEEYEQEIRRVMEEVDIAARLGVKLMRHDVARRSDTSMRQFRADFARMTQACGRIADYAAQYGITTSVENHGYFVQASDRVQALVDAVNRPNFKTTLDIGNFLCVDEDPVSAVKKSFASASMIHIKDFYRRPSYRNPGAGWFRTASGNFLRGAITGQGDIDMWEVLRVIKDSGYSGYLSVEFEGMEDCKAGSEIGMNNLRRIWDEV